MYSITHFTLFQMKKLVLFTFLWITYSEAFTQNFKAVYQIDHLSDLNLAKTEYGVLLITKDRSVYATENYFKKDSIFNLIHEGKMTSFQGIIEMREKGLKTDFEHLIQKKYTDSTIKTSEGILIDNYVYQQSLKPKWELVNETKEINNYACQKAITTFQGRTYVAWYSAEIPFSDGPFKFWGLPGLIVHIQDSNNEFNFQLISFKESKAPFPSNLNSGRKNIETSFIEFQKIREKSNSNRADMMKSMGMDVSTVRIDGKPLSQEDLRKMNRQINYIEKYL